MIWEGVRLSLGPGRRWRLEFRRFVSFGKPGRQSAKGEWGQKYGEVLNGLLLLPDFAVSGPLRFLDLRIGFLAEFAFALAKFFCNFAASV